jgi:hypothetical protein
MSKKELHAQVEAEAARLHAVKAHLVELYEADNFDELTAYIKGLGSSTISTLATRKK